MDKLKIGVPVTILKHFKISSTMLLNCIPYNKKYKSCPFFQKWRFLNMGNSRKRIMTAYFIVEIIWKSTQRLLKYNVYDHNHVLCHRLYFVITDGGETFTIFLLQIINSRYIFVFKYLPIQFENYFFNAQCYSLLKLSHVQFLKNDQKNLIQDIFAIYETFIYWIIYVIIPNFLRDSHKMFISGFFKNKVITMFVHHLWTSYVCSVYLVYQVNEPSV